MELKAIQSGIQQVVSAISAVLKIEVEVADHRLFRVAGTGQIKQKIWQEMSGEDVVFRHCLETVQTTVIDRPGFHPLCASCGHYMNCVEAGEICTPISVDGKAIGVIGLIAMNEEQKERLFGDLKANINFLEKMADVIASKIKEYAYYQQQLLAEKKISTLLNFMDNGILMLNQKGECEFMSAAARSMLELKPGQPLPDTIVQQLLKQKEETAGSGKIIYLNLGTFSRKFFATYHRIDNNDDGESAVIVLDDPDYITSLASHLSSEATLRDELISTHPAMVKLKEMIPKIASSHLPVLIQGLPGTGKHFAAQYIHRSGNRAGHAFVRLNCSFYSEAQLDLELFGGSDGPEPIVGKLELADGGTLYLEEIHQLPLSIQVKLLKFLENRLIRKQGDYYEVNVRIIASTDKQLADFVRRGAFRQDLYYKLNMIPITLPPLEQRKQDILPFAQIFLQQHHQNDGRAKKMDDAVIDILLAHDWPGNIQELKNVIEYACHMANTAVIEVRHLPDYIVAETQDRVKSSQPVFNLQTIERETIKRALLEIESRGGRKEEAAALLGISRATLFRKIKDYRL